MLWLDVTEGDRNRAGQGMHSVTISQGLLNCSSCHQVRARGGLEGLNAAGYRMTTIL